MSGLLNFYRAFLNLPLSLLVKSRSIPTHPVAELELNLEQPIVYVLPYTSQTDLLILQKLLGFEFARSVARKCD